MITVNNSIIVPELFGDGTYKVSLNIFPMRDNYFIIDWKYENEAELVLLQYIVAYIKDRFSNTCSIRLKCWYLPNARMDRVKNVEELFTLKYFASIINSLNFDRVEILDPHSKVTTALINKVELVPVEWLIIKVLQEIDSSNLILFFPDKGAYDRYIELNILNQYPAIFGNKVRDWDSGVITSQSILKEDTEKLKGKDILIIDDIISSGNTICNSIDILKKEGANNIYIYCSHLENRIVTDSVNKLRTFLDTRVVTTLYTSKSLFNKTYNNIKIVC